MDVKSNKQNLLYSKFFNHGKTSSETARNPKYPQSLLKDLDNNKSHLNTNQFSIECQNSHRLVHA